MNYIHKLLQTLNSCTRTVAGFIHTIFHYGKKKKDSLALVVVGLFLLLVLGVFLSQTIAVSQDHSYVTMHQVQTRLSFDSFLDSSDSLVREKLGFYPEILNKVSLNLNASSAAALSSYEGMTLRFHTDSKAAHFNASLPTTRSHAQDWSLASYVPADSLIFLQGDSLKEWVPYQGFELLKKEDSAPALSFYSQDGQVGLSIIQKVHDSVLIQKELDSLVGAGVSTQKRSDAPGEGVTETLIHEIPVKTITLPDTPTSFTFGLVPLREGGGLFVISTSLSGFGTIEDIASGRQTPLAQNPEFSELRSRFDPTSVFAGYLNLANLHKIGLEQFQAQTKGYLAFTSGKEVNTLFAHLISNHMILFEVAANGSLKGELVYERK